jgi:glyceraldehyde 3-phosphate dehydrogenase
MTVKVASNGFCCIGNQNPHSSNDASTQARIVNDCIVRVLFWYDNKRGFSCRLCDTAVALAKLL